jgi:hypothetical protein
MNAINGSWLKTIAQNLFSNADIRETNFWHINGTITTINTTPLTLYTPPEGARFYLTDILLSVSDDNLIKLISCANGWKIVLFLE